LADPLDTVKLHIVLLDGQCRFLETQENILVWPKGAETPFWFWDGKMADGSAAPTGEYYINLVREWRDGSKDTSWSKSGYIRTQCGGPLRVP
jgi:flagellar hook assembly protein FlgD